MAGIGFTLERMAHGRVLSGAVGSYIYAAFLVSGPWIFTVLGIAGVSQIACPGPCMGVQAFRSVIIYNSAFALIVTSPIAFVATRFISDQIYLKRYQSVTFTFAASLALFAACATAIALPFYVFATTLTASEKLASCQNLMLIGAAWLLISFLGAMKQHRAVSAAFAFGTLLMVGATAAAGTPELFRLLTAFNLGLGLINATLVWRLVSEYGIRLVPDRGLWQTAICHWELPLIGLAHGVGLWIDKIIMWFAVPDEAVKVAGALQTMPNYDTPMFWAQLAALPVLAVFFVHVETNFFRLCRRFYGRLDEHVSLRELEQAMSQLGRFVLRNIASLFLALIAIALLAILVSYVAVDPLGLRVNQLGILRAALIGMACHTSAMFCLIFLLYFDLKKQALAIATTFVVLNALLTVLVLPFGFPFFGYGNMEASAITMLVAFLLLVRELPWLHYHAFVTNNSSLRVRLSRRSA
jgi:polysaccharide biosynthesis protein PelG